MINGQCACMGKNFEKFLQPHILMIIVSRPMYGLEIIEELAKHTMFLEKRPDPTGVYRYLKKMESAGLLSSSWEVEKEEKAPKKFYSITPAGKDCLRNWTVALGQYGVDITELVAQLENCVSSL